MTGLCTALVIIFLIVPWFRGGVYTFVLIMGVIAVGLLIQAIRSTLAQRRRRSTGDSA